MDYTMMMLGRERQREVLQEAEAAQHFNKAPVVRTKRLTRLLLVAGCCGLPIILFIGSLVMA
jgi:hypothetical protein